MTKQTTGMCNPANAEYY